MTTISPKIEKVILIRPFTIDFPDDVTRPHTVSKTSKQWETNAMAVYTWKPETKMRDFQVIHPHSGKERRIAKGQGMGQIRQKKMCQGRSVQTFDFGIGTSQSIFGQKILWLQALFTNQ